MQKLIKNKIRTIFSSLQIVPIYAEPKLFDSYYNGCCNGTFWPLFHSMPDRAIFIADHWKAYIKCNEEFADKTVHALHLLKQQKGNKNGNSPPIVWLHDYHLMLAANWIRQVCPRINGFQTLKLRRNKVSNHHAF